MDGDEILRLQVTHGSCFEATRGLIELQGTSLSSRNARLPCGISRPTTSKPAQNPLVLQISRRRFVRASIPAAHRNFTSSSLQSHQGISRPRPQHSPGKHQQDERIAYVGHDANQNASSDRSAIATALLTCWYFFAETELSAATAIGSMGGSKYEFEAVSGYFVQGEADTDAAKFDYTKNNFGLLDRYYPKDASAPHDALSQWQRFDVHIHSLNSSSAENVSYKLLYMGRHGEGDHNVAEAYYGTQAWDDHWSKLDGNGTASWSDAHLTAVGRGQALAAHAFFAAQLADAKMPAPEMYYVSPLYRCLQTAQLTFDGLTLPEKQPFRPLIKELLREVLGEHTCDRRSSKTAIREAFAGWAFEAGFAEEDGLWQANHRETHDEHDVRTRAFLTDIFAASAGATYISLTSHSGAIASHLRVLGHREFRLPTGGMIPVLVKATKVA